MGLTLQNLTDENMVANFDCGISSINIMVRRSFYSNLLRQTNVQAILFDGKPVGFCATSIRKVSVSPDNTTAPFAGAYEGTEDYTAINLDYIAVEKKLQKNGIGKVTLLAIIQQSMTFYQKLPIRLLFLEALNDKVDWYKNLGFLVFDNRNPSKTPGTTAMYVDLMPQCEKQALQDYQLSYIS